MKIFLSYRFTGEDQKELASTIGAVTNSLRENSHEVYCSLEDEGWFREKKHTNSEIMEHAFQKINESDLLLAFIRSNDKSEGMLVEIGYAIGKGKRFALALRRGAQTTSIHEMANPLIEFESIPELCQKLNTAFDK